MHTARLRALTLVLVLLLMSATPLISSAQSGVTCCNSTDFRLYLMGESDDGTLTPFQEDLASDSSDSESTLVTPSILSEIKVGTWEVTWGTEGNYENPLGSFQYHMKSKVLLV